jgi:hypothetical protein
MRGGNHPKVEMFQTANENKTAEKGTNRKRRESSKGFQSFDLHGFFQTSR